MEKSIIVNLIKEVNSKLKNRTLSEMLVTKVNSYHAEGLSESEVFNKLLGDVKGINQSMKSPAVAEIIENYTKFQQGEKYTIKNMANEAGLFKLLTGIRASNSFADPVIKTAVSKLEESLSQYPEFRVIPSFIEVLKPFNYEHTIKNAIAEATSYIQKNATKLVLLNAIYEFNMVPAGVYKTTTAILEQALLDNQYSTDSIKMKLRESLEMPAIKRLVSNLAMVEAQTTKGFDLGIGNGKTQIISTIVPVTKTNEQTAITVLNNRFVEISANGVSYIEPKSVFESHLPFYNFVLAFSKMNFTGIAEGIKTKMRNTEISFVNEGTDVSIFINKTKIEDPKKVNYAELFVMENAASKASIATVFEGVEYIKSLDFVKTIASPKGSCNVVRLDKKIFVLEHNNSGQVLEMNATQFVKFVKENYDYDTTSMFSDELDSTDADIANIDAEKHGVNGDIASLEKALSDLDAASGESTDPDIQEKVEELRFNIEKNINALKEKYIQLDSKKKALLEHNIISSTKKYNMDDQIKTKDGRFGKVRGVDTSTGRYMVAFEDNRILPVSESEII